MNPRVKKLLSVSLRAAVCAAALWFVARGVTISDHVTLVDGRELVGRVVAADDHLEVRLGDGSSQRVPIGNVAVDEDGVPLIEYGLKSAWQRSDAGLLFLALMIHLPVGLLQAERLRLLLRAQEIHIRYWECVKFSFAGNFLNFAAPLGSNVGDVFKAYFASLHTQSKTEAMTTIVLDRMLGLATLLLVVTAITAVLSGQERLDLVRPYAIGFLLAGLAGLFIYLSPFVRRLVLSRRWTGRLPAYEHLKRIDAAALKLVAQKTILFRGFLLTVALQVMAIGAYFTVAVAVDMDAGTYNVLEYYAYFYTGSVIQALPGPPQGLGTVELAYRFLFGPYGTVSQILCMAFAIRVIVLLCALPGVFITFTGSYKPRCLAPTKTPPPDKFSASTLEQNERPLKTSRF